MAERIVPRPEYTYVPHKPMRIDPNPNYVPCSKHSTCSERDTQVVCSSDIVAIEKPLTKK